MIGQDNILTIIDEQIMLDEFPRFSIIVGAEGSGKKTLTREISEKLNTTRVFIDSKIDAIRQMITDVYTIQIPVVYVINGDTLSVQAKEALLKICEETPKNAYIILLTTDISLISDTLRSRAGIYHMQPYTPEQILEYAQIGRECVSDCDIVVDLCETLGDVDKLYAIGKTEFYEFVEKVVDSIASVSPANALKITTKIDTKNSDPEKYDVILFLRAFKSICGKRMKESVANDDIEGQMWYSTGIKVATDTLKQTKITGINKGALLDIFILNIRREWA